jgi:diadenosine tetraphosphate (Ap4A) HIT family hydrolase
MDGRSRLEDWKQDRVGGAERGENPTMLLRMPSGYAFIGDTQFLPGYCVLTAVPQVNHLTDLPFDRRGQFLLEMSLLGEAVTAVCTPRRINYEILGNSDAYLHAHVWARYEWEPAEYIGGPVWRYPREQLAAPEHAFSEEQHGELRQRIKEALEALMQQHGLALP